jgi:hypothetical protein
VRRRWLAIPLLVLGTTVACGGNDMARICTAESHAHASAATDWPAVHRWLDAHLHEASMKAFVAELDQVSPDERTRVLRDRAAQAGLLTCPLADAWAPGARESAYAKELLAFCSMSPPLDPMSVSLAGDGGRVDLMLAWVHTWARTPELLALVEQIAAAPPRDRGLLLRRQVEALPTTPDGQCRLADALDAR